jgi:hypothetical protein
MIWSVIRSESDKITIIKLEEIENKGPIDNATLSRKVNDSSQYLA